eukprot:TRINITY_DN121179_c0_g1_i1.p1 TRINITY_DN121179_c0_g1~~TRINITY_DN121179_c0_g1_i1.p1  ORF type:complete len:212 (+),score=20.46 TRINITY_DN121179_c0_g1_i1:71-706(+)
MGSHVAELALLTILLVSVTKASSVSKSAGSTLVSCDTTVGQLDVHIHPEWSPKGAEHFLELVKHGYYSDIAFFRAVPNFLVQFGINENPQMKSTWGSTIQDDPPKQIPFRKGTLSYAGGGRNSRTNQVFFSYGDNPGLGHSPWETAIGQVAEHSMNVLDKIYTGYGDMPPWGTGPEPGQIEEKGNAYIRENFPQISFIRTCQVVAESSHDL